MGGGRSCVSSACEDSCADGEGSRANWSVLTGAVARSGEVNGVCIPFASPSLLPEMKSGSVRHRDRADVAFLSKLTENQRAKTD